MRSSVSLYILRVYTCFRHINRSSQPSRPITVNHGQSRSILVNHKHYKPKIRARGQAHGPGAWSFAKRARFKIAARVGRIAATAPMSKLSGWLALVGAGWLVD